MTERRRSARIDVELPIWLKDGHGGERTTTTNVSAHGVSVRSHKERALRQYVELELTLFGEEAVGLTAMVTRQEAGSVGLDFFAVDAAASRKLRSFLEGLAAAGVEGAARPPPRSRSTAQQAPASGVEKGARVPSFLVKPRDVGRLWAFYRGELSRGVLRLESPVPQAANSFLEVVVVHPRSGDEWTFFGRVEACRRGRSQRPLLEVVLFDLDEGRRAAFRSFLATGIAPVSASRSRSSEARRPDDVGAHPRTSVEQLLEALSLDDEDVRLPSVVIDTNDFDDPAGDQVGAGLLATEDETVVSDRPPPLPKAKRETAPEALDASVRCSSDVAPSTGRGTPFAQFFWEAGLAPVQRGGDGGRALSRGSERRRPPPLPGRDARVGTTAEGHALKDDRRKAATPGRVPSGRTPDSAVLVTPAPSAEVIRGSVDEGALRLASAPPAVPGSFFELEGPRGPETPSAGWRGPRVRRRAADERAGAVHQPMSTASEDPALDRSIGLARARVVRAPDDVDAASRLAELLFARGRPEALEEAIGAYERVLALEPGRPAAYARLGGLLARAGRYEEASDYLRRAERMGEPVDSELRDLVLSRLAARPSEPELSARVTRRIGYAG